MSAAFHLRRALPGDGARIAALAEAVRFRPETADAAQGYLVKVLSASEYAALLDGGGLLAWMAEEADGRPLGFLSCLDEDGHWYVDQIAVAPAARGRGVAQAMHARMMDELAPRRVECHIMHAPLRNERSRGFFTSLGYTCTGEEPDPPYLWGRYRLTR